MCPVAIFLIYSLVFVRSQHTYLSTTPINNVVVSGQKILIGSVNSLSLISSRDLTLLHNVSTGPVRDSPLCNHDGTSCLREAKPVETENHNKILQIVKNGVLTCGSVRQGTCSTYSLSDLSLIHTGDVPVAANSANASTVCLKAGDRLVVAASHAFDSPYRDPFPAVAIRDPNDYFVTNSGSLEGEGAVYLRAEYRSSSPIQYVSVFRHQHFVYITAVQSKKNTGLSTTQLIRFCANDTRFVSYSEIELQCRSEDNSNYPILTASTVMGDNLIATFRDVSSTKTAICSFSLQRLKLTFWYNIDRCRGGSDSIGLPHIGRDAKCTNKSRVPLDEDTCELGVGGSIESVEIASRELDELVFSLHSFSPPGVLLAGTSNGEVVLMKWEDSQLNEFGRRVVGGKGDKVAALWLIGQSILAQLPKSLVTVPLAKCVRHSSCSTCLMAEDPLCQWCHSLGRCTTTNECSARKPTTVCPLEDGPPVPARLSVDDQRDVFVAVKHLPKPRGFTYQCIFDKATSLAKWNDQGVICGAPSVRHFGNTSKLVQLSVRTSLSSHSIVQHNFTLFDCTEFNTCAGCASSEYGCDWCPSMGTCARKGKCKGKPASECVRIDVSPSSPIMVSNGHPTPITIPMKGVELLSKATQLTCAATVGSDEVKSKATIYKENIVCDALPLSYTETTPNISVSLSIKQGTHVIDSTKVTVFDCSHLAGDCSSCLALPPLWGCGWCSGRCSHDCASPATTVCDRPQVLQFWPSSGPREGGTVVTILGRDLGSSIEDVRDRVWVAGSRCNVIKYTISRKIVCRLEKGASSGPIRVAVGRATKRTAESTQFFSFVDVSMFSIHPLFGPVSGGTKITVYGQNLNAGSNASMTIGGVDCNIAQRNSSASFHCFLSSSESVGRVSSISLKMDDAVISLESTFNFRPDPVISTVRPLTSFRSGGRAVTVEGTNLDSVLNVKMFLVSSTTPPFEIVSELSPCQVVNSTRVNCLSPRLLYSEKSNGLFGRFPVGFAMDNVTSVRNLGYRIQMKVVPDPQLAPFEGIRIHQGDQPLILDGEFLSESAEPNDYKIFIGNERCYVTLIDSRQLVCNGPQNQPMATDEDGNPIKGSLPLVSVRIGKIRSELGLIEYADSMDTIRLWALVLTTMTALCIVLLMLLILWRKRRNERERDYKKIQLQMEHLESNVRKECKQAFAELQTSISFNAADEYSGGDFLSFREFVSRVLWSEGGPAHSPSLYASTLPLTLAQFDSLISCKQFVFALVESAESDSSMSPSEKSMLSSLLLAALLRNFHYCTEVVLDLLRAHIAKTVHSSSSELLFRKSESLVEKLIAKWLSICLHEDILNTQGLPFYRLYKALRFQTERGPVDAVTGSARYTINEAKLLRETVDTTSMDCLVMDLSGRGPFLVRLNACDTISQLKQKALDIIYKDIPYSQRPQGAQFDLEWQCPRRGNVLLSDLEGLTEAKGARRLNTVSHYGIPHGALLIMVAGSRSNDISGNSLADSGQSSWTSLDRSSPFYSSSQCYHLTNPTKHQTLEKKRKIDENIPTSIPEVYLTRLLTSKGTVQKFIDDFLESVLFLEESSYPPVLKYVFDLLEEEGARNGVSASVVHQWKVNLYVLRVWANLVNNPRLILDVGQSVSTDGNLTVVAQTLADCFSSSEPVFGAHAPSSRLLFAKEVSRLRPLASDLLRRVSRQPKVTERDLAEQITNIAKEFNNSGSTAALSELLAWVRGNGLNLVEVMSSNSDCVSQRLPQRLSQVVNLSMEPDHIYCSISEYSQ